MELDNFNKYRDNYFEMKKNQNKMNKIKDAAIKNLKNVLIEEIKNFNLSTEIEICEFRAEKDNQIYITYDKKLPFDCLYNICNKHHFEVLLYDNHMIILEIKEVE